MSNKHYIIPIFVPQEGCPHKCVFCNQDKITGIQEIVTAKTVYDTVDEYLATIKNENATIELSFFGGTFTGIKEEKQKELLKVAKEYKDKKLIHKIHMSTRPDYINRYILDYLKEYEVDIIELGVQSLDEEVLRASGRGHSIQQVEEASKLINEYGITLGHQIMVGLPKDKFSKDIDTVKRSIKMKPKIARIYPALVIKDTPMEKMYVSKSYVPYTLDEAVEVCKELYSLYSEAKIQVIRMGLQPTDEINLDGEVVQGPFHPAFRELVEGSLMVDEIKEKLNKTKQGEVFINPKDLSKLYCNKKQYFNKLIEQDYKIKVTTCDKINRGELVVR